MNDDPGDPPPEHSACLGLGSNSDAASHLTRAVSALRGTVGLEVVAVSTAWESPAVGTGGPDYLNAALLLRTHLTKDALKSILRRIENDLGRDRTGEPSDRVTIDIDLLIFDDEVPGPDLWSLAYRGLPVSELLPDLTSPATGEPLTRAAVRLAETTRIATRPDVLPPEGARGAGLPRHMTR